MYSIGDYTSLNEDDYQQSVEHTRQVNRALDEIDEDLYESDSMEVLSAVSLDSNEYHNDLLQNPRDGALWPAEADYKRAAFFHYLKQRYPQHSEVIAGKSVQNTEISNSRTRASYAADSSYYRTPLTSSSNESDITYHGSLSRGGRLRSSLPLVRSKSRSRERPLGIIYLEYSGESRATLLPNELTSLDTIRALFVQSYPGLLTMPMLDPQRHTMYLKNKKHGTYDEIDHVGIIKDRAVIRTRPNNGSGIPLPGSKKPAPNSKPSFVPKITPKSKYAEDINVAERNQKNQEKRALKPPTKPSIRQYQSAPSLLKQQGTPTSENRSRLPPKNNEFPAKVKGKAPTPPPRSTKPKLGETDIQSGNITPPLSDASSGNARSGIGLGGGSIPHKGFAYIRSDSSEASPNQQKGLRPPNPSRISPPSTELKKVNPPNVPPKPGPKPLKKSQDVESKTKTSLNGQQQEQVTASKQIQPRSLAFKSPPSAQRFGLKKQAAPEVPSIEQPSRLTGVTYTNIKRSASPERRATINSSGGYAGYCKAGRSFKGQQLKPVSIPQVPDINKVQPNLTETSQTDRNVIPTNAEPTKNEITSADNINPISGKTPPHFDRTLSYELATAGRQNSPAEQTDNKKEDVKTAKRGLFGLKRLVSSRSSSRANQGPAKQRSQSADRTKSLSTKLPETLPPRKNTGLTRSASSLAPNRTNSPSPDSLSTRVQQHLHKPLPSLQRQPSIPKTELLTSLIKNDEAAHIGDRGSSYDEVCLAKSVETKEQSTIISNSQVLPPPLPIGVLKNSNLEKSSSSTSILSDSGSNLSTTPSLKTKKVSFQENVTVCDSNGVSTYSTGLRRNSTDLVEPTLYDQSLSNDVTEHEVDAGINDVIRAWRAQPNSQGINQVPLNRLRPGTPHSMLEKINAMSQNSPNSSQNFSLPRSVSHQSAVAAAIQSISGAAEPNPREAPSNFQQRFAVSCASPVPTLSARTERPQVPHKENWSPLKRPTNYHNVTEEVMMANPVQVPTDHNNLRAASKEPSYFETQNQPDTPPYYECCETRSQPITPNQLKSALGDQDGHQHHLAVKQNDDSYTHGGVKETLRKNQIDISTNQQNKCSDDVTKEQVIEMERHLDGLTGMMESISNPNESNAKLNTSNVREQLLKLKDTSQILKNQLNDLKRLQRSNMENMNELVAEKAKDLSHFISSTAGAQHRPLRMRRFRLDENRHQYGANATSTEKQLSEVEAAVEELRNEVVERRCRVNSREVEALVLQLSQAGKTVARLKGSFPALCEEIRIVSVAESEVIYAEEKFLDMEPGRLDEQLKRCKQLTATLFTLKKLATVQEARSKTPTNVPHMRPNTPIHPIAPTSQQWRETNLGRKRFMEEIRKMKVDNQKRMASLQDAQATWMRRRKFIRECDSKKFEKALEMAERALNRTDHVIQIEQRQSSQLIDLYNLPARNENGNLTTSESSSIESLPPPPPPSSLPLPPNTLKLPPSNVHSAPEAYRERRSNSNYADGLPSTNFPDSQNVDFQNPNPRLPVHNSMLPGSTSSLPRYPNQKQRNPGYQVQGYTGTTQGRETPVMMERSRSVTPSQWTNQRLQPYDVDATSGIDRKYLLDQQQILYTEKNQRLKEQYSKLQHLQKKQRLVNKQRIPSKQIPSYQHMSIAAKSSDV